LAVLEGIEEREKGGVLLTSRRRSSFFGKSVPFGISLRVWWCFFWRFILGYLILSYLIEAFWNGVVFAFVQPNRTLVAAYVTSLVLILVALSLVLMRQVLAKNYKSFDLFIRKKGMIQPAGPPDRR
jgi:hypothetical protein